MAEKGLLKTVSNVPQTLPSVAAQEPALDAAAMPDLPLPLAAPLLTAQRPTTKHLAARIRIVAGAT